MDRGDHVVGNTGVSESRIGEYRSRQTVAPIHQSEEGKQMLWTIAVILFVLWALGLVTSYTLSGYIHILLVLAIVALLIGVIQGRRPIV